MSESMHAGAGDPPPVTLSHTASYRIASEPVGRTLEVRVAEPVGGFRGLPEGPRRVLYVLDGDLFFGMATELTRLMHQLYGELPPLLVVGIGYGTGDPALQGELRARDFTFSADPGMEAMATSLPGAPEPTLPEGERLGGGEAFLRFLTEELPPFLAARYDVASEGSVLFGSSLGGLFASWALLRQAAGIDHYIIASPALWWNGGELLAAEPQHRGSRERESRVFLGVGAGEEDERIPMLAQFRLVTNTRAFGDALAEHPDISVTTQVFEGESHTSVVAPVLTRGLRTICAGAPGPAGGGMDAPA